MPPECVEDSILQSVPCEVGLFAKKLLQAFYFVFFLKTVSLKGGSAQLVALIGQHDSAVEGRGQGLLEAGRDESSCEDCIRCGPRNTGRLFHWLGVFRLDLSLPYAPDASRTGCISTLIYGRESRLRSSRRWEDSMGGREHVMAAGVIRASLREQGVYFNPRSHGVSTSRMTQALERRIHSVGIVQCSILLSARKPPNLHQHRRRLLTQVPGPIVEFCLSSPP